MRIFYGLAALALATTSMPAYAQDSSNSQTGAAVAGAVAGAVVDHVITTQTGQKIDCKNIDITNLSQTDVQNIQNACAALAPKQDTVAASVTPEKVEQWASLAKEFGSAMGATAHELGVQVNDFLRTPAGVLLTLYLFWHKLGGVLVGIPFVIAVWMAYYKIWDRMRRTPIETETRPVLFGLFNKNVITKYKYEQDSDTTAFAVVGGLVVTVITAIILAVFIL